MVEVILSVIGVVAGWICAWLLGYSVGKKRSSVNKITLADGSEIHMWKGFVDPTNIYVAHGSKKDANFFYGDSVVFNEKGNIIIIDKNVEEG